MLTWIPNGDYTQPNTLKDITNAWPTNQGYKAARDFANFDGGTPLGTSTTPVSGFSYIYGNTFKGVVSHNAKIKEYYTGTDLSRTVGGAYIGTEPFFFTANADAAYATNYKDALQKFSFATSSTYENVATTCPVFKIIVSVGTQLIGFNTLANIVYETVTYFANGSRWWCSQAGAPENFTPRIANLAATDILSDQDGEITAAIELNGTVVAFKRSAIYVGVPLDPVYGMAWRKVHSEYGCIGPYAVTKYDNRLYFVSPTNGGEICMFDGSSVTGLSFATLGSIPALIASNVTQLDIGGPASTASLTFNKVSCAAIGDLVYFNLSYSSAAQGAVANMYVYNTKTGRFGRANYSSSINKTPAFIWAGAEAASMGALVEDGSFSYRCGVITESTSLIATFSQFRQVYGGRKYSINSGQMYVIGVMPSNVAALLVSLYPSNPIGQATVQSDGRFTFIPLSAAQFTFQLTVPVSGSPYEITRIELNIANAGDNKSAPGSVIN
jgi:hypothetical protein